jgi:hypothetical protein
MTWDAVNFQDLKGMSNVILISSLKSCALSQERKIHLCGTRFFMCIAVLPKLVQHKYRTPSVCRNQFSRCSVLPFILLMARAMGIGQAISVAERVAMERCEPPPGNNGSLVGYQVRLDTAWLFSTSSQIASTFVIIVSVTLGAHYTRAWESMSIEI